MARSLRAAVAGVVAGLLLGATAGAGLATAADTGAATVAGGQPTAVDWQPCADAPDDDSVRCATLQVPVDWAHPHGATFGLALAEHRASDGDADRGPLLINPGGPGGSGVDFALGAEQYFSADLLAHFDVVGFDPRGVGRSHPVRCSTALLTAAPNPVPTTRAGYRRLLAYNAKLGADCRRHTGPLFDHVDTLSVVRDIDAIRGALGVRQISYYGVSYGTLIGQQYAATYPGRVRAAVVDSNMDHSLHTTAFLRTETAGDEDVFDEFVSWCGRDTTCALHGRDAAALYDSLMRRADAGRLTNPSNGATMTAFDLSSTVVNASYGPQWKALASWLSAADAGTTTHVAAPWHDPAVGSTRADVIAEPSAADDDLTPYAVPVFCEDWSLPVYGFGDFRRLERMSHRLAPHLRYSPLGWSMVASCLNFPAPVNNPQRHLRVHTDIPLLLINAEHDPATPYVWARHDARILGRHGRLVTYQGWGHGTYGRSDCTTGVQDRYLIEGSLPDRGATCAPVAPDAGTPRLAPGNPSTRTFRAAGRP